MYTFAKIVLDIMHKNKNGVRCLVTIESLDKPGVLRHAFLLVKKVHTTSDTVETANGMLDAKVIFATGKITTHAHINEKWWRSAQPTKMFFQPSVISPKGNTRSHVSVQDLKAENTCWNQTCKLPQCMQAVLLFSKGDFASANQGTST